VSLELIQGISPTVVLS